MDIAGQIKSEIKKLQNALRALEEQEPARASQSNGNKPTEGKRVVSAASRRKMAAAQKARWAKVKKAA